MPTSSKPDWPESLRRPLTEPFVYPLVPGWASAGTVKGDGNVQNPCALWGPALHSAGLGIPEEEVREREKAARALGTEEGRGLARQELEKSLLAARAGVAEAIRQFRAEREAYFQRVEAEVVRLALSIARKILHRESQLDPALLAGIVRVAMGKFDAGTSVKLRVHRGQARAWQDALAGSQGDAAPAEIAEDDSLGPDQCILETRMGSTELSLEAQLKEIEQGFFDLLAQRPGATP